MLTPTVAVLLAGLLAASPCAAGMRALLAGIEDYRGDPLALVRLPFADTDRRVVHLQLRAQAFDLVAQVPNQSSDRMRLEFELNRVIMGANLGDVVLLFLSARGIARPRSLDGYILAGDSSSAKPQSTGIPISYLSALIEKSKAERFLIIADVSREPAPADSENRINALIARLANIPGRLVEGLLGSTPGTVSTVDPSLVIPPAPAGLGVFTYHFASTLSDQSARSQSHLCTPAILRVLRNRIPSQKQVPAQFGPPQSLNCNLPWPNFVTTGPVLVASRAWLGLLAAPQFIAPPEPQYTLPDNAVRNPVAFVDELIGRRAALSMQEWENTWPGPATALASEGQKTIVRYGTTDLLPDDPLKVDQEAFRTATAFFSESLRLIPVTNEFESFRQTIEARRIFCEVQASQPSPQTPRQLSAAAALPNAPIAEIENALGVYYLERQPDPDYREAVRHFQRAADLAPAWGYPKHNLALAWAEQGDYSRAERELRNAIAAEPHQPYLRYNLGILLQRTNRRRQAQNALQDSLRSYNSALIALYTRASEWTARFPGEAEIAVRRFEVFSRNRGEVLNALGAAAEADGDEERAMRHYQAAELANEKLCAARYNRARLLARTQTSGSEALHLLNSRLCPDFHPSLGSLGSIALAANRFSEARQWFAEVRKLAPRNIEALRGLARVDAATGNWKDAVKLLEEAVAYQPRPVPEQKERGPMASPGLLEDLAKAKLAAGDKPGACRAYRDAVAALKQGNYEGDAKALKKSESLFCDK